MKVRKAVAAYNMGGFMEADKVGGGSARPAKELFSVELPQKFWET